MTTTLPIQAKVMIGVVAAASLCALSFGVVRLAIASLATVVAPVGGSRAVSSRFSPTRPSISM